MKITITQFLLQNNEKIPAVLMGTNPVNPSVFRSLLVVVFQYVFVISNYVFFSLKINQSLLKAVFGAKDFWWEFNYVFSKF